MSTWLPHRIVVSISILAHQYFSSFAISFQQCCVCQQTFLLHRKGPMSNDSTSQSHRVLAATFRMQCAHLPFVVHSYSVPIDVIEVLMLKREKVVIPINRSGY